MVLSIVLHVSDLLATESETGTQQDQGKMEALVGMRMGLCGFEEQPERNKAILLACLLKAPFNTKNTNPSLKSFVLPSAGHR